VLIKRQLGDSPRTTKHLSKSSNEGYFENVLLNGKPCKMQIDTAADHTIMYKSVYRRDFSHIHLRKSNIRLCPYTDDSLSMYGELLCEIVYGEQNLTLPLTVVDHPEKLTLLGRSCLAKLRLNWSKVLHAKYKEAGSQIAKQRLHSMLKNKSHLCEDNYGGLKGHEPHIRVKPVYHTHRRVPYALREPVEAELQKLEENGRKKLERSEWASLIIVVPKADRSVRICGDYKVSINPSVEDEQIILPTTQDLYVQMAGSKVSHNNTHKGLYAYLKLRMGLNLH